MKIGVCLKQVPATDSAIKVNADASGIVTDDVKWIVNPYDEFALEAALQLKEAGQASEVVVLSMGGADSEARIKDGLARGAGSAIRLDDDAFAGSDSLGVARVIAAACKKAEIGLLLCGRQSVDTDNWQVPAMVAELLGWGQVTAVSTLELEGESVTVTRAAGGGSSHVVETALPAVLTCDKGLNTPRFATLKGIMMAKRKKIACWGAADLGLEGGVGADGAHVTIRSWAPPAARPAGRVIEGDSAGAKAQELVRLLREEAKVI